MIIKMAGVIDSCVNNQIHTHSMGFESMQIIPPFAAMGINTNIPPNLSLGIMKPRNIAGLLMCCGVYQYVCTAAVTLLCSAFTANAYYLYTRSAEFRAQIHQSFAVFPELIKYFLDIPNQIARWSDSSQR